MDPETIRAYLEDASGRADGACRGVVRPVDADEAARSVRDLMADGTPIHPQAARSSLTGGAVPREGVVLSVERLREIGAVREAGGEAWVEVGAGVRLSELDRALAPHGWFFPPAPTYREAMVGGVIATSAGGPASFKYGVVRSWVAGIEVVLAGGWRLTVPRGACLVPSGGAFDVAVPDGSRLRIPAPCHRLPALKKISAGYFASDPLDLIDLFIGSEGTLGVVVSATLALAPLPPEVVTGLAFVAGTTEALALAAAMRDAAVGSRRERDPRGPDLRAIELLDRRCLEILAENGDAASRRIEIPREAGAALTFEMELAEAMTRERAASILAAYLNGGPRPADGPIVRTYGLLDAHGALDGLEIATTRDAVRAAAIVGLREAAPMRVNEILARRRLVDPAVTKTAGDLIVPVEHLPEIVLACEREFSERGLDHAVWGHVSDGNLHPNAICRSRDEVEAAEEAQLRLARAATALGGAPLSEHGVGRSALKKRILREFLGEAALDGMRAVKAALDPRGLFAPGVLL